MLSMTCALLCGIAAGCSMDEMTDLKDISQPYVGEYKCKELRFGEEDRLKEFESVKLTFGPDDAFILRATDLDGTERAYEGKYKFTDNEVKLSANFGGEEQTYVFPYEKGAVHMRLLFNEKLLYARFTMVE